MQNSEVANKGWFADNRRCLLSVSILAFGFGLVGYLLIPRGLLTSYILAHLGALGVLGLFGCAGGFIAMKKGRSFYSAFLFTGMLPILLGGIAVLCAGDPIACGGSISLATAILILAVILFLKKRQLMAEVD